MKVLPFIKQSLYSVRYYLPGPLMWVLFYSLYGSLKPYLLKLLIDGASPANGGNINTLITVSGYFIALMISYELFYQLYDWCDLHYKPLLRNHIAYTLTDKVLDHEYRYFQNQYAGNITSKIIDVIEYVPEIVRTIIDNYLTNIFSVVMGMYLLWQVHSWFALALGAWALCFVIISVGSIKRFSYLSNNSAEANASIIATVIDILGNVLNIKLFASKNYELSRFTIFLKKYFIVSKRRRWFLFKLYTLQAISYQIYQAVCLFLLIYLFKLGKVTPGDFALILTLNLWIIDCMWDMSDRMRSLSEQWGSVDQALKLIYLPVHVTDHPHAQPLTVMQGEIRFKNVKFHYHESKPVFDNLTVTIPPKQKVGLVGYSGSGKTTFVNLLLRIYDIQGGQITIDGQDISEVTQNSLRESIGIYPQDPSLFHRSIVSNIRYSNRNASFEEIQEVARKVHADQFITASEKGYNTQVGERGMKLSGGQRQRVALARVVLKDAPILIMDEATSQLDSETERVIRDSLDSVMKDKTAVIIAHRLSTLLYMDRILVFDKGKIIQDGTHAELAAQPGLYKTLWENQSGGFLPAED